MFFQKIFANPWFDLEKLEFNDINIDKLLDIQDNQSLSRLKRGTYEDSG